MNRLQGNIVAIEVSGAMSVVSVAITEKILLKAIVIETPETAAYLHEGSEIAMLFKETEVIIGTGENHRISLQNKIPAKIRHIEKGALLSKINLDITPVEITAIISTHGVAELGLKARLNVTAMIMFNVMMLSAI
jgi:molybdopterin-binding protein